MAYDSGFLNKRIKILARRVSHDGDFGRQGGEFEEVTEVWANVSFVKGMNALREGAIDAYDTKMVRTRFHSYLTRECRIRIDGTDYKIDSLNSDRGENTMQLTVSELQK